MAVTRRQIPWQPSKDAGPLGRSVEHDEQSHSYAVSVPERKAGLRRHVLYGRHAGPFNQGQIGSCTGEAATGCAVTNPVYRPYHNYRQPMALKVYKRATEIDGFAGVYPPDDTGSSGLAACKAAVEFGLFGSYEHAFGIEQALDALQVRPVMTGVDWYEGFDYPDADGKVKIAGQIRGGHEFEILEFDPGNSVSINDWWVRCCNSWGADWGLKGFFWMRVSDWATLLGSQGDVTVPKK